ncbi:MAG: hypothetical protein K0S55_1150 [Clostridia bacterium]|nr:hypothetical protein [Clostridia bacterium]
MFNKNIEPDCSYCKYGYLMNNEEHCICKKYGFIIRKDNCKNFSYNPLNRVPKKHASLPQSEYTEQDFIINETNK